MIMTAAIRNSIIIYRYLAIFLCKWNPDARPYLFPVSISVNLFKQPYLTGFMPDFLNSFEFFHFPGIAYYPVIKPLLLVKIRLKG